MKGGFNRLDIAVGKSRVPSPLFRVAKLVETVVRKGLPATEICDNRIWMKCRVSRAARAVQRAVERLFDVSGVVVPVDVCKQVDTERSLEQ